MPFMADHPYWDTPSHPPVVAQGPVPCDRPQADNGAVPQASRRCRSLLKHTSRRLPYALTQGFLVRLAAARRSLDFARDDGLGWRVRADLLVAVRLSIFAADTEVQTNGGGFQPPVSPSMQTSMSGVAQRASGQPLR